MNFDPNAFDKAFKGIEKTLNRTKSRTEKFSRKMNAYHKADHEKLNLETDLELDREYKKNGIRKNSFKHKKMRSNEGLAEAISEGIKNMKMKETGIFEEDDSGKFKSLKLVAGISAKRVSMMKQKLLKSNKKMNKLLRKLDLLNNENKDLRERLGIGEDNNIVTDDIEKEIQKVVEEEKQDPKKWLLKFKKITQIMDTTKIEKYFNSKQIELFGKHMKENGSMKEVGHLYKVLKRVLQLKKKEKKSQNGNQKSQSFFLTGTPEREPIKRKTSFGNLSVSTLPLISPRAPTTTPVTPIESPSGLRREKSNSFYLSRPHSSKPRQQESMRRNLLKKRTNSKLEFTRKNSRKRLLERKHKLSDSLF